jgi:hypothetical protein
MSTDSRLAALQALARKNEKKLEELRHTNWLLNNHNIKTQDELSKFEENFSREHPSFNTRHINPTDSRPDQAPPIPDSPVATHVPHTRSRLDQRPQPPGPFPTPFYLAAREAPRLNLDFVIPGFKGETLEVAVNNIDLAFILQQTLRRRGWGEAMVKKGVEDFLEQPMMKVTWTGREGEFGYLS